MERKLVWESCLYTGSCGLLEMYILLTDDVVEFGMFSKDWCSNMRLTQYTPIKEAQHQDLLIPLLIAKCPVSVVLK